MAEPLSEEDLDQLEAELSEDMHAKLILYAKRKISKLRFAGARAFTGVPRTDIALPGGNAVEDLVQEAYRRVLAGKRKWNRERYPTAFSFLRGAVDSLVSNLVTGAENRRTVSEDLLDQEHDDEKEQPLRNEPVESRRDPRQQAEDGELDQLLLQFRDFVAEDSLLADLVDCFRGGVFKKQECAEYLGVDVKLVYAAQKRLNRKRSEFRKAHLEKSYTVIEGRKGRG